MFCVTLNRFKFYVENYFPLFVKLVLYSGIIYCAKVPRMEVKSMFEIQSSHLRGAAGYGTNSAFIPDVSSVL